MDLLTLIACFGLTEILMFGSILNKPRNIIIRNKFFKELLECSLCTGFWSGIILGSVNYFFGGALQGIFITGLASAGFCFFFDSLLDLIMKFKNHDTNEPKIKNYHIT